MPMAHIVYSIVPSDVGVERFPNLLWCRFRMDVFGLENCHYQVYAVNDSFVPDNVLGLLVSINEALQLFTERRVVDLGDQGVNGFLEGPDSIVERHPKNPLSQRTGTKGLSQEEIEDATHDHGRVRKTYDLFECAIWYHGVYTFSLRKQLGRVVFSQEEMIYRRSYPVKPSVRGCAGKVLRLLYAKPLRELLVFRGKIGNSLFLPYFFEQLRKAI